MASISHSVMLVILLDFCGCIIVLKGDTSVILSPSGVAPVCSEGQLELMCSTAGGFQEWDFHISENMTSTTYGRLVNNQADLIIMPIQTESFIFNISRVSLSDRLPLVSKLSIITKRSIANGTEVTCTCIDAVTNARASTTVIVITYYPIVNLSWTVLQQPQSDSTNFTLTWNESVNSALFSYHVFITPDAPYTFAETRLTIEILFNVYYNVSIVASHLCGQTTHIANSGLYHPDCGGQDGANSLVEIIDYLNLGARNITFPDCPTLLTTTTESVEIFNCDPPSPPSNGYIDSYNRTEKGLTVNFVCQNKTTCICQDELEAAQDTVLHTAVCTPEETWKPNLEKFCSHQNTAVDSVEVTHTGVPITVIVATSFSALLVSSVTFFIVGFLCGLCFSRKAGGCTLTSEDRPSPNIPAPVYESITPTLNRLQEQDVELKENVAYM